MTLPITLEAFRYFCIEDEVMDEAFRYLKSITYKELQNLSVNGRLARVVSAFDYGSVGLRIESQAYRYMTSYERGLPLHDQKWKRLPVTRPVMEEAYHYMTSNE